MLILVCFFLIPRSQYPLDLYPDQMVTAVTRSSPYPDQIVDQHLETTSTALNVSGDQDTYGAFPLHGTVRFGTARYGTVRLSSGRFAFPPQFSTAIEWAGLFTRRYNCAASTAVTSS